MFREVGRLHTFPIGNQVLQKRAGYRELLRAFALVEIGGRLALNWDVDDVFGASQRNVATLYEYWAFLQLARSVGHACGKDLTVSALQLSSDDMSMAFRSGAASRLQWATDDGPPADFFIAPTHMNCQDAIDGQVVVTIARMGVPIGVIKDRRSLTRADTTRSR